MNLVEVDMYLDFGPSFVRAPSLEGRDYRSIFVYSLISHYYFHQKGGGYEL